MSDYERMWMELLQDKQQVIMKYSHDTQVPALVIVEWILGRTL